ncbi:hypothetical protein MSAN_00615500 [Mycena sanguinolenta]|uniref:Uncharacterized protein n=1 Tax=Mycena sanguinolenta TaxID=230812 RepID=A0A8H7DCZ8_9AGAR|nr:hypothetical protein MSAN_00615500 [Mycena sanguinolenta]
MATNIYDIGQSPPFHLPGRSLIALESSNWAAEYVEVMVVEIDYRNPDNIVLSQIYCNTWRLPGCEVMTPDVAVDDKMVVMTFTNRVDQLSMLAYCNLADGIVRHIPLGVRLGSSPVCLLKDGDIYIHGQDKGKDKDEPCTVVRVCPALLQPLENINRITLDTPSSLPSVYSISHIYHRPQLRSTPNGVVLVTRKLFSADLDPPGPSTSVPSVQFCSILDGAVQLEFIGPASYEHHFSITHLTMGTSGTCAVILDMEPRQGAFKPKNILGVLRYKAGANPSYLLPHARHWGHRTQLLHRRARGG